MDNTSTLWRGCLGYRAQNRTYGASERGFDAFAYAFIEAVDASAEHGNIASGGQIDTQRLHGKLEDGSGHTLWGDCPTYEVLVINPAQGEFVVLLIRSPGGACECVEPPGGCFVLAVELAGLAVHAG